MLLKEPNNRTILLADDDEDDRGFFADALSEISSGDRLLVVENGIELMSLLVQHADKTPDILFLDLNMPVKNGYECLAEIRCTEQWKNLPIVIISTSLQPEAVDRVYKQGASLYIVKPNNYKDLKAFIEKVLWLHQEAQLLLPSREKFILRS
jgi:CheY-like chemotaxis protein